jgi:FAD:protein FMN transferase
MAWKKSSAVLLLLPLLASGERLERFERVEPHMGTLFRITLFAADAEAARSGFDAAFARVGELDQILSDYKPESELMRVCRDAWRGPVPVSTDLFRVLAESQKLAGETDGAFDVTLGPVIRLWRKARRDRVLPRPDAIAAALRLTGYKMLVLDAANRTVFLRSREMLLDLGGIAKGYAADEALGVLRSRGLGRALVAASGDLAVGDAPVGQSGWRVEVQPADGVTRRLVLANTAVSTSGDTEQFVEIDGVRYSHIVNPKTGLGLADRIGVTIVASRGIVSDSMATAVSVLGATGGLAFAERQGGVAALIARGAKVVGATGLFGRNLN